MTQISWFCQVSRSKRTRLIKNLKFEQNFQHDSNFLILPYYMFFRTGWSKIFKFGKNFQCDLNFLILPNFDCSKILNLKQFSTPLKFYWYVQISPFAFRVVKNLKFEQNFQHDSNFLIFPYYMFFRTGWSKIFKFGKNFQCDSNFLILPNFNCSKILNLKQFSTPLKFYWYVQILPFACRVVKNVKFEQNFQRDSNFLILPYYTFCRTGVVKNVKF